MLDSISVPLRAKGANLVSGTQASQQRLLKRLSLPAQFCLCISKLEQPNVLCSVFFEMCDVILIYFSTETDCKVGCLHINI